MSVSFVRSLGSESGVQTNPLQDDSELPAGTNSDQIIATMLRATRGRIDKAFKVNSGNVKKLLGKGESLRASELNEAWVQVVESLNNGAYEAVVSRLSTSAAVLSWIVVTPAPAEGTGFTFSVSPAEPAPGFFLAFRHLDCFNDGIKVRFRAEENRVGGAQAANSVITLQILDVNDEKLAEYTGSLVRGAKDDSGNSTYLPEVIEKRTDSLELITGAIESVAVTSDAYGYNASFQEKWAESAALIYFVEGGTAYTTDDYVRAREQLQGTQFDYGYIASCGSKAPALIAQLVQLAYETNIQLKVDIPGSLNAEESINFIEQLNLGASTTAHLIHAFWHPAKASDPTGINGKIYLGTSALNAAYCCARNAIKNSKGFSKKNYPIAGREWKVNRSGIVQTYTPTKRELSALARAKINPVTYEVYSGGGRYVWRDSLTCAMVDSSLKKLIAVADMSCSIDDAISRFGKDILQLPMKIALKRMNDYLTQLFKDAQASDWLVPSSDPEMGGGAWKFVVQPDSTRPYEKMVVQYKLRYDGTTRQIENTQILSR